MISRIKQVLFRMLISQLDKKPQLGFRACFIYLFSKSISSLKILDIYSYSDPETRLHMELLEIEASSYSRGFEEEGHVYDSITFPFGVQSLDESLKTELLYDYKDEDSLRNPLRRLQQIPAAIDNIIDNLREGMSSDS